MCANGLKLGMFLFILVGYVEMFKCFCLSLVACVMIPFLFYQIRQARRPNWMPAPPNLIKNLYKTKFNPTAFNA